MLHCLDYCTPRGLSLSVNYVILFLSVHLSWVHFTWSLSQLEVTVRQGSSASRSCYRQSSHISFHGSCEVKWNVYLRKINSFCMLYFSFPPINHNTFIQIFGLILLFVEQFTLYKRLWYICQGDVLNISFLGQAQKEVQGGPGRLKVVKGKTMYTFIIQQQEYNFHKFIKWQQKTSAGQTL